MSDFQAFAVRQACLSPPLRPNPTQLGKAASTTSLIKQKGLEDAWGVEHLPAMMNPLEAMINPFEAMNYLRPSNQLVLLLQKGVPFPVFPPELAECIDERTWQKRMEELHTALSRYWSWVEKALFAFAFIASITAPWPVISAVSAAIESPEAYIWEEVDSDDSTNGTSAGMTDLPSRTIASATRAVSATATNLIRRQLEIINGTVLQDEASSNASIVDDGDEWPGYEYWTDGYTTNARWAAIGILIGIVIAVWLPWTIWTIKNSHRLRDLILVWNREDADLGPMRSLTWSLDKAPAFSNAKFLIIGLPPCLQQQASVFHHNAYPPAYGQSGANFQPNVLSYYHDQSYGSQVDDKESWYAPPQPPQEQIAHGYDGTRVSRDREDQFQLNNRTISAIPPASSEGLTPRAACETADRESTPHVPAQTAFEDSRGRY